VTVPGESSGDTSRERLSRLGIKISDLDLDSTMISLVTEGSLTHLRDYDHQSILVSTFVKGYPVAIILPAFIPPTIVFWRFYGQNVEKVSSGSRWGYRVSC
jgi:hypothetical protein